MAIFESVLMMISTYKKSLLKDLQVSPQHFNIIFATLTMVQCFSVQCQDKIYNTFRNNTLAFISIPIFISFILVGFITTLKLNKIIIIIAVIVVFFIHHFLRCSYWVLQNRYITNFTNYNIRDKILSVSQLIKGVVRIIILFLGRVLLEYYSTSEAYIIIGVFGIVLILLVLAYMKSRIGLSAEEYDKKDIEYVKNKVLYKEELCN